MYLHKTWLSSSINYSIPIWLVLVVGTLFLVSAFAIPEPAPGASTQTLYCQNGICSTNGTNIIPYYNATRGQYDIFHYPNGIPINLSNKIGVQLSQACVALLKNQIPNNCTTYDQIQSLDNTNPYYSGLWIEKPYLHRGNARVANFFNFNLNKFIVMLDPNPEFEVIARMIIIQPGEIPYINPVENSTNGITHQYFGRYVSDCANAIVASTSNKTFNVWLINDTIHYLESGCKITNFNGTKIIQKHLQPFDYTSLNVKTIKYMSNFSNHTNFPDCITKKCSLPINPYHTHDKKFGW